MHGFRDNDVLVPTVSVVNASPPQFALLAISRDGFWNSEHDYLIVNQSNFSTGMHGFPDNEVYLQAGYDIIVISPLRGASGELL